MGTCKKFKRFIACNLSYALEYHYHHNCAFLINDAYCPYNSIDDFMYADNDFASQNI